MSWPCAWTAWNHSGGVPDVDLTPDELQLVARGLASLLHWARDEDQARILALRERVAVELEGVRE